MKTEKRNKAEMDAEMEAAKTRLLMTMMQHIGQAKVIGMGDLYEQVFMARWDNRINDTRPLRRLVTKLRKEGVPICSRAHRSGGGYWLAGAGSEMEGYCKSMRGKALRILAQEACLRKMTLAELFGQLQLEL